MIILRIILIILVIVAMDKIAFNAACTGKDVPRFTRIRKAYWIGVLSGLLSSYIIIA